MVWYLFGLWMTPYQFFIPADTPERSWSLTTPNDTSAVHVVETIRAKHEPIAPMLDGWESKSLFVPMQR